MNILSLPVDKSACGQYRIRKPLSAIKEYTSSDVHILDMQKDDMQEIIKVLPNVDVIFIRPGAEEGMRRIKNMPALQGILKAKWVMDIDDNTDYISPYSQFYKEYGQSEYTDPDTGLKLWQDGVNGFSLADNAIRLANLEYGLREVDMVTVTTEKLAEFARKYNDNVYINDNSVDLRHWWVLNSKINKPLRVVWQGSPSHYEDWYAIKDPLNKLMDEYDFKLILLGSGHKSLFKDEHKDRVEIHPWIHFDAHSYRMMSLQGDIGIIPLADLPFNHYKSSIKWYENAAMGLPSIVSNVTPYKEEIQDGKTAMAYSNNQEFYDKMKQLLDNKGLRKNIANNARQWVEKNKTQKKLAIELEKRLKELCQK